MTTTDATAAGATGTDLAQARSVLTHAAPLEAEGQEGAANLHLGARARTAVELDGLGGPPPALPAEHVSASADAPSPDRPDTERPPGPGPAGPDGTLPSLPGGGAPGGEATGGGAAAGTRLAAPDLQGASGGEASAEAPAPAAPRLAAFTAAGEAIPSEAAAARAPDTDDPGSDDPGTEDPVTEDPTPVDPVDLAPVAAADSAAGTEDTSLTGNVLANDSDPEAGPLAAVAGVFETAAGGRFTLAADGSYLYEPPADWNGADSVAYTVTDAAGNAASAVLSLAVAAVNDAPRAVAEGPALAAAEDAPFDATLPELFADIDAGDVLSWSVTRADGTPLPAWLSFDPATRNLSGTPAQADVGPLTLRVTVTDSAGATATQSLTLAVAPTNDAPDAADLAPAGLTENPEQGALAATVLGHDPDGDALLTYTLLDDADGRFVIDAATGEIRVADPARIDFETDQFHDVTVRIADPFGGTLERTFRIDVANQSGHFVGTQANDLLGGSSEEDVIEGLGGDDVIAGDTGADRIDGGAGIDTLDYGASPAGVVVDLAAGTGAGGTAAGDTLVGIENLTGSAADDRLSGDAGANTLAGGAGDDVLDGRAGDDRAVFGGVQGDYAFTLLDDGGLQVADTRPGAPDGTDTLYDIETLVFADGTRTHGDIVSELTNTAPHTLALAAPGVAEDAGPGTLLGTASASDADAGASLTYSLVDDAGGRVVIDPATGELRLAPGAALDHETAPSLSVTVRATDQWGAAAEETFAIAVGNVNEAPTDVVLSTSSVPETASPGSAVATLSALDPDLADAHSFTLVVKTEPLLDVFKADPGYVHVVATPTALTGSGTGLNLTSFGRIYEGGVATDAVWRVSNTSLTDKAVTLKIGAELHSFTVPAKSQAFVASDTIGTASLLFAGKQVSVKAAGSQDFAANGLAATPIEVDPSPFEIVGSELRLRAGETLDHDAAPTWQVTVTATDAGGLSVTKTLTVDVAHVNQAPVATGWQSGGTVGENLASGGLIGQVAASDPDASGALTYALKDDAGGRFAIDPLTGEVRLAAPLDFEAAASHAITVEVTDAEGAVATAVLTVSVMDEGEIITGTPAPDILTGSALGDTITGLASDDTLTGLGGDDMLSGGEGNDTLDDGAGNDTVFGGAGDDLLFDGEGADALDGGEGSDTISLHAISGGVDNRVADTGTSGTDTLVLRGGTGNSFDVQWDFSLASSGIEIIDGSALTGETLGTNSAAMNVDLRGITLVGVDAIEGGDASDTIVGSFGSDVIRGGGGGDVLSGDLGADTLDGGDGDDTLIFTADVVGSPSAAMNFWTGEVAQIAGHNMTLDVFKGGAGFDILKATDGNDALALWGSANPGTFQSIERFDLGAGNDVVDFAPTAYRVSDSFWIRGEDGNDTIWADIGNDTLDGGAGDDRLSGAGGDDTLIGGTGSDLLDGSEGNDLFVFETGSGADKVLGGAGWTDTLELVARGAFSEKPLTAGAASDGWWLETAAAYKLDGTQLVFADGDASGTLHFADGATIAFDGIDRIGWT